MNQKQEKPGIIIPFIGVKGKKESQPPSQGMNHKMDRQEMTVFELF